MLFMLLIAFLILSSKIKLHISTFLDHLQTITTFAPLILPVLFFFSHISITNLSLSLDFVVFLAMAKLKRGIDVMILSLIIFVSPTMLSFGNIALLSSFLTFVAPYLPFVLDLFPDEPHLPSIVTFDPPIDFSIQPLDIFDASLGSPSNEQVEDESPNLELRSPTPTLPENLTQEIPSRHSTRVRSIHVHLLDYHCYIALATLHEPHTYRKVSTDPL